MNWLYLLPFLSLCAFSEPIIIPHGTLQTFNNNGNTLTGLATPRFGAEQSEVWQSSIAPGSKTPTHKHAAEEIVILINGTLKATVGGKALSCSAPCTIILPANIEHELENTGTIPSNQYLVMPLRSKIFDSHGQEMNLPWRH